MNAEIFTVGDTPWVNPPAEVMAAAFRLLEGSLASDGQPPEVLSRPRSESGTRSSVEDDSVWARLADVTRQEGKRCHLLKVLQRPNPPWDPSEHPELDAEGGAAAWVKKLRRAAERAFEKRTRAKEQG